MYNSQDVAKAIKQAAKDKGVKIGQMLSDCGLSKNALSTMQSGGSLPHTENLCKIADYLGLSLDYMLGREVAPGTSNNDVRNTIINRVRLLSDDEAKKLLAVLEALYAESE